MWYFIVGTLIGIIGFIWAMAIDPESEEFKNTFFDDSGTNWIAGFVWCAFSIFFWPFLLAVVGITLLGLYLRKKKLPIFKRKI